MNDILCLISGQMNGSCLLDEEKDWSKEEKALIKTARMLTGRPVRLTDNFFNVGGNSLNAVTFVTKLRDQGFDIGQLYIFERFPKCVELIAHFIL